MKMTRYSCVLLSLLIFPQFLLGTDLFRPYDPVFVMGNDMTLFLGAPVNEIFAYAFKDGMWRQIPFQIDEKDTGENFFGSKNGVLDVADVLVFMAADVGDSVPDWRWINDAESKIYGRFVAVVEDPILSVNGYVYIYRSSTLSASFTAYMNYILPETGFPNDTINAVSYVFGHDAKGIPVYLTIKSEVGGSDIDILDRWKIRYAGNVFGYIPFHNNEDNGLRFKSHKVKVGPVRIIRQATFYPVWGEAILVDSLSYVTVFYPYFSKIETGTRRLQATVGMEYMRQSVDYVEDIVPSYFHNPNNFYILINGEPDVVNKNIVVPGINWFMVHGPHGSITTLADMPDIGVSQNLFYNDSSGSNQYDTGDMIAYGETGIEVFGDSLNPISGSYVLETSTYYLGPEHDQALGDSLAQQCASPLASSVEYKSHVIPVELAAFYAQAGENNVRLMWRTATESNNYGFNIERKAGEQNWRQIGFIRGSGTATKGSAYEYLDNGLAPDIYQYRLRQVDSDGSCRYSDAVEVQLSTPVVLSLLQNYPNPFNPATEITFLTPHSGQWMELKIFNLAGQEIRTLISARMSAGEQKVIWDGLDNEGHNVPSGIYIYRLKSHDRLVSKKMTKLD